MKSLEELIEVKRDGGTHTADELQRLVDAFVSGEMPDYQMAAWLMAAFIRGLDSEETAALTGAMARSGRMVDLSAVPGVKVDKHSTGGVGDTTTLVLAPLVASCGVPVAKMSGRGLGFTGGTLDKLESIPGFTVTLEPDDFLRQVRDVGCAVIGQSPDVDPADKKMYALRDVTATVPSVPLIVGSIISKKVAGGADAIVLDVKVGSGAFMKTESDARELAAELTRVGALLGREVVCVLTDMDQPLGRAVGNALEVREAIATLKGEGPADLTELCLVLGSRMLVLGGVAADERAGRDLLLDSIATGSALDTFRAWVHAQGGDERVADDPSLLPAAAHERVVTATRAGWVSGFDAEGVGRAAMAAGAGRARKEDAIDPAAGLVLAVKTGDRVEAGDPLGTVCSSDAALLDEAGARLRDAVVLGDEEVEPPPLFLEV
ncbi:thymidine phosphorylase [Anaerosoma tenue]|uniref:thymidine phosphorylase n=1 Tax=Anaerosoma tenue TaxID=2933588 RepID=UPI002260F658|nr:thymidine phosphorylase [Anaerosoma tenue]MCK8114109.1 thymidine phosphorylase [Anaerosoma tenue]